MKKLNKLILGLVCLLPFLLTGCDDFFDTEFVVWNDTEENIAITGFYDGYNTVGVNFPLKVYPEVARSIKVDDFSVDKFKIEFLCDPDGDGTESYFYLDYDGSGTDRYIIHLTFEGSTLAAKNKSGTAYTIKDGHISN